VLGDSLDICGMFLFAAEVYGQVAGLVARSGADNMPANAETNLSELKYLEVLVRERQGASYMANKQWEAVEETFLCGLRIILQSLHCNQGFQERETMKMLKWLTALYMNWYQAESPSTRAPILEVVQLFLAMCKASGCWAAEHRPPYFDQVPQGILVNKYYKRAQIAKNALGAAFKTDSVNAFRASVCSWKRAGVQITLAADQSFEERLSRWRKQCKETARESQFGHFRSMTRRNYCMNPSCTSQLELDKLSKCGGCGGVYYW
jgi:hypothetical protein